MKIRQGFVSNSSSSSFIVSKDKVIDWKELIKELEKLEDKLKEQGKQSWGDNGETFEVQNDYISVETHYCYEAYEVLDKQVIDLEDNSYLIED